MKKLLKKILPFIAIFAIIFSLLAIPSSAVEELAPPAPSVSVFGPSSNYFHIYISTNIAQESLDMHLSWDEEDYPTGTSVHHYYYLFSLLFHRYSGYIVYDFILDHTSSTSTLAVSQFTYSTTGRINDSYIGEGFLWDVDSPTTRQNNITPTAIPLDTSSATVEFTISSNPSSVTNFNVPDREYFLVRYPVPCYGTFSLPAPGGSLYGTYYYHDTLIGSLYASVSSDSSYSQGYSDGFEDGQADGYDSGYSQGSTVGYSQGYTAGESVGYSNGLTDGYQNGVSSNTAYQEGYIAGEYDGHQNANIEDIQSTIDGISDNLNDDNWLEGFTRGMWKGVTDLYTTITNGISINGFLLSSLITTLFALLAVFFVIKIISKG